MTERPPSYLSLCRAEPFRIFFPLATLIGISGVSLWPLFFSGLHKFYPGPMHARLMIEGFLGGFVIGFLGTAVPRLLSAPVLRAWQVWLLVILHLLVAGLHIGHQMFAADAAFATQLLVFASFMLSRLRRRAELPPPSFVLVALGYFSGLAGVLLWIAGTKGIVSGEWMLTGGMWLNEAFLFLLVLGVGGFLLPRFLRIEGLPPLDEERKASSAWLGRALFSLAVGGAFLASYWFQAARAAGHGAILSRAVATLLFLLLMVPVHRGRGWNRAVPQAVLIALLALVCGVLFPWFAEGQRVAGLHIVFLAGFSVITFTVATRVVLGHSGNERLFETSLPSLCVATAMLLAGAVLRAWGDFSPQRPALLDGASYLWMAAALIWGIAILPKVRHIGAEEE
jgi:uncharacterized protein involved in response to NO